MDNKKFITVLSAKGLLPFSQNFATNASLAGWSGTSLSTSGDVLTITPTLGVEKITNGDMSSDTGWTVGANWAIGSGVAEKTAGAANNVSQNVVSLGKWYQVLWQLVSRTAGSFQVALGGGVWFLQHSTPASYTHAGISLGVYFGVAGDAAGAGIVDNVSVKEITPSSMMAIRNVRQVNQDVTGVYNTLITGGPPIGVLANVASDGSAGLAAFINGVNIYLYKWVGATWTALISTTYTDDGSTLPEIKTQLSGSDLLVDLLYAGAAKGTQQTVSNAEIVSNTYAGLISSASGNKIASFFVQAP